jgi:hypothetical protein
VVTEYGTSVGKEFNRKTDSELIRSREQKSIWSWVKDHAKSYEKECGVGRKGKQDSLAWTVVEKRGT